MFNRVVNWLLDTVLLGAIPFLVRTLIAGISTKVGSDYAYNVVDLVTFGLVLNIANFKELETRPNMGPSIKKVYTSYSVVSVVLFAVFLGIAYVADLDKSNALGFNTNEMVSYSIWLGGLSFLVCGSLVWRG